MELRLRTRLLATALVLAAPGRALPQEQDSSPPREFFPRWCVKVIESEPSRFTGSNGRVVVFATEGGQGLQHFAGFAALDSAGAASVEFDGQGPFVARIDRPGFARQFVRVEQGHELVENPQGVSLQRPAWLFVHLAPLAGVQYENEGQFLVRLRTAADAEFPAFTVGSSEPSPHEEVLIEPTRDLQSENEDWPIAERFGLPPDVPLDLELHLGEQVIHRQSLRPRPGENRIDVQLAPPSRIHGTVRRADGSPLSHYPIGLSFRALSEVEYPHCEPVYTTDTDEEGRYELPAFPGEWWIGATCAPCVLADLDPKDWIEDQARWPMDLGRFVTVPEGEIQLDFEADSGRPILGRVTLLDRAAVGAQILAINDRVQHGLPFLGTLLQAKSDLFGHFALTPIPPGQHRFRAVLGNYLSDLHTAQEGAQDVELELHEAPTIRGRVVDGRTGEGCVCEIRPFAPVELPPTRSKADGSFEFFAWPGPVDLYFVSLRDRSVHLERSFLVGERGDHELEVSLEPAASLVVEDGDGDRGWWVEVGGREIPPLPEIAARESGLERLASAGTDGHGFLLPPGTFTLHGEREYYRSGLDDLEVRLELTAGTTTTIRFFGR